MKIFSWNVNGIRAVEKKGSLGDFLAKENPDIVCFQETKIQAEQVSSEKFDEKYPEYSKFWSFAERKGYAGTSIWTKIQPEIVVRNFPREILANYNLSDKFGDATKEGRICAAFFGDFWLLTVYTPNAKGGLERLELRQKWDAAFLDFAKKLEQGGLKNQDFEDENSTEIFPPAPVFFCGDLNVAHEEIDLARPKQNRGEHGFTDEERAGFSNFVRAGFVDILRAQNPETGKLYTWWSYYGKSRERNVGWRIDYFLTSGEKNPHQVRAKIHPRILGSDHCPVSIEWSEKNV